MSDPKKELYREGLTIRDHFAGRAMQALIAAERPRPMGTLSRNDIAVRAYEMADAMLQERERER